MHTFKDNASRTWTVAVNVTAVKRCRATAAVDIYGLVDGGFTGLAKLLSDPVQLVDVLYVLCRDDADRLGVSDEDFGRAMAGDCIEHAATAFVEELIDFFPDARVRAALAKVIEAGRKVQTGLVERLARDLDAIDPDDVVRILIASSGSSPGSSGSTRGRSRSGNST